MRDWLWNRLNDLRVRMILNHAPARSINRVSRMCRWLWRYGYHANERG